MDGGQVTLHGPSQAVRAETCAPLRRAVDAGTVNIWAYGRGAYPGTRLPPDVLPQLCSVGCAESRSAPGWRLERYRARGIEICGVTSGSARFTCGDTDYELDAGSMTITRPWQPHRIAKAAAGRARMCWFVIDVGADRPNQDWRWPSWLPIPGPDLERLTDLLRHNETPVWSSGDAVGEAISRLERALRGPVSQPVARVALGIAEVMVELTDHLERQQIELDPALSSTERVVTLFLEDLADRLDEPWTLNRMAESCGLGRTRFVYYCKQAVNVAPQEYLTELRLNRAAELLHSSDLSIAQVALRCGFQTGQYFSTAFRRRFGCTPGAIRSKGGSRHAS